SLDLPSFSSPPSAATLEFESEPAGADVKTSTGQTCRTPCSLSVTSNELTATFTLNGYQQQTVPVKLVQSNQAPHPGPEPPPVTPPRMSPNPVYVEPALAPPVRRAAPTTPTATKPPAKKNPKAAAKPKQPPAASEPMAASPSAPAAPSS